MARLGNEVMQKSGYDNRTKQNQRGAKNKAFLANILTKLTMDISGGGGKVCPHHNVMWKITSRKSNICIIQVLNSLLSR